MPISETGHTTHRSHYLEYKKCNYFSITITIYAVISALLIIWLPGGKSCCF
jgi:undecaprenyl pyrophosphate phosphatase UppP